MVPWRVQRATRNTARVFLGRYLAPVEPTGERLTQAEFDGFLARRRRVRQRMFWHDVQVSAFGGAGTTLLCSQLGRVSHLRTPRVTGVDWAPWKHMPVPPTARASRSFRAIYVVSDPRDAVASVFRRNFQHGHIQRLEGDALAWDFGWDLSGYLQGGRDLFHLDEHVTNWTEARRDYPILVVKYDAIWDTLGRLSEFVGLAPDGLSQFPARVERETNWRSLRPPIRDRLDEIYGALAERIEAMPDCFLVDPEHAG